VSEDGRWLVTGSRDTTAILWELEMTQGGPSLRKRDILYGHDGELTSVAVSSEYDMVLTGSLDGTCIVHSLRTATYIRTLKLSSDNQICAPSQVCISSQGASVISASHGNEHSLWYFGINGKRLKKALTKAPVNQFAISSDGKHLIVATDHIVGILRLYKCVPLFFFFLSFFSFFFG